MREIAVVTVARSDYGIYFPILKKIEERSDLRLRVLVSGMHLSPEFGMTVQQVERDFEVFERVESLHYSDQPDGVGRTIAAGVLGFTQLFSRYRPDILLVLGDRYDILPAPVAALPFKIPVAHLHGGELTEGNIDDAIRHMITKLAHIHFVSTDTYAKRLRQLGEEPWRIHCVGAPGLDSIQSAPLWDRQDTGQKLGFDSSKPYLLVTFHPETLQYEKTEYFTEQLLEALDKTKYPVVFTCPNADTCGAVIIEAIKKYTACHDNAWMIDNAGRIGYPSLMSHALAMVGNSSSGIIEAAHFALPVVNIGNRQTGRVKPENVVDCGFGADEIVRAINRVVSRDFRTGIEGMKNPYGDGKSSPRIVDVLASVELNDQLIHKIFFDIKLDGAFQGIRKSGIHHVD